MIWKIPVVVKQNVVSFKLTPVVVMLIAFGSSISYVLCFSFKIAFTLHLIENFDLGKDFTWYGKKYN